MKREIMSRMPETRLKAEPLYLNQKTRQETRKATFQPLSVTSVVIVNIPSCMVKYDASFPPVCSHTPLPCLISHCL